MNVEDVHVNRDGTIRWNGDGIGRVEMLDRQDRQLGKWRAEIGDAADPETWPPYRACYALTRNEAVAAVLDGIEAPEE